jgi:CRISPR-associated endonuclease Cas1
LVRLSEQSALAESLDVIRGYEGSGAHQLFSALARGLDSAWGFTTRIKRPPPDPVNSMLSFGYTLLHQVVTTALTAAGCDPRVGLFHSPRAGHLALASDLQEEWRWVVDRTVRSLALSWSPGIGFRSEAGGCRMDVPVRLTFCRELLGALTEEGPGTAMGSLSILERIGTQAIRFREWATGHAEGYRSYEE